VRCRFAITVDDVVDGALVIFLEDVGIQNILPDKHLLAHFHHLIFTVFEEYNDIVDIGTVTDKLILLHPGTDKSFFTVYVELLVGFSHLHGFDIFETAYLCPAWVILAVTVLQHGIPRYRIIDQIVEMMVDLIDFLQQLRNEFVGFIGVEFENTRHLNLHEPEDIIPVDLADKGRFVGFQALINMRDGGIHIFGILKFLVLVDPFLDEYLLQ